ncbi:MAG TPA: HAD-IIB family hydrolase [Burkholderiales bacterium]
MKPRAALLPLSELRASDIRALLFDVDDTLTTDGRLTADAYSALERLKRADRIVVPVTGRPAGWCDHIARMWPVDAVVGENGAFYFWYGEGKLHRRYQDNEETRRENLQRMKSISKKILSSVPGSAIAADQAYRETDLAIDYREDVPALPLEAAERIAALMREAGLTAKVSSIHVNGWFGAYDKLAMAKRLFAERFSMDLDAANRTVAFVGDSPNDEPMFGFFENSVGVANVRSFRLASPPRFVTREKSGQGFVELAAHLLK